MKFFLVLFALPFSAFAATEPREMIPGDYAYQGSFELRQKRRVETVLTGSEEGRSRLLQLRRSSYQCQNLERSLVRCVKVIGLKEGEKEAIAESADAIFRGLVLSLSPREGKPELVSEGASFVEWLVPQAATFRGVSYRPLRYLLAGGRTHKLAFGQPAKDGVLVREDGRFGYLTDLGREEGRNVLLIYTIEGVLAR